MKRPPLPGAFRSMRWRTQALKLLPQPQVLVALGLLKTNPFSMSVCLKSIVTPFRYRIDLGSQMILTPCC